MNSHYEIASAAVAKVLAWQPQPKDHAVVESAEVIIIDDGEGEPSPGVEVRWRQATQDQGQRSFGLVMSVSELVDGRLTEEPGPRLADLLFGDLWLALLEPQGSAGGPNDRTVFRFLP